MSIHGLSSNQSYVLAKTANSLREDVKTPPTSTSKVENGVWYLDYTSWDPDKIPKGVNMVNLFVSGLDGQLEGFSDPQKLKDFVAACHAQGIEVKMSIGGHGGKYDNCWDELNGQNTSEVAKRLVDFCHEYDLDGIDFDYEENQPGGDKTQQETYVGQLIKSFKEQDPNLLASLCTCADPSAWKAPAEIILDQTKDSSGKSMIDHLYIMSYVGTTKNVEQWASGWEDILKEYQLPSNATTIGIASNPGYDVDAIAKYAAEKGFSTMVWNYNPALEDPDPDALPERVYDDYYPKTTYQG